jgi:hypothetical protein
MDIIPTLIKRYLWIVLIILLVACGNVSPQLTEIPITTDVPTQIPVISTPTGFPTKTLVPAPSLTPLLLYPLEKILVGQINNGIITTYDSGIALQQDFYLYSFTFVILPDKADK